MQKQELEKLLSTAYELVYDYEHDGLKGTVRLQKTADTINLTLEEFNTKRKNYTSHEKKVFTNIDETITYLRANNLYELEIQKTLYSSNFKWQAIIAVLPDISMAMLATIIIFLPNQLSSIVFKTMHAWLAQGLIIDFLVIIIISLTLGSLIDKNISKGMRIIGLPLLVLIILSMIYICCMTAETPWVFYNLIFMTVSKFIGYYFYSCQKTMHSIYAILKTRFAISFLFWLSILLLFIHIFEEWAVFGLIYFSIMSIYELCVFIKSWRGHLHKIINADTKKKLLLKS